TAAEAIVAAMDRDLKAVAAENEDAGWKERRAGEAEREYLDALVALGDKRVAPTLAKRAGAAATLGSRRRLALAVLHLGDPKPLEELAKAFEKGSLPVRGLNDPPDRDGRRPVPADL